MPESIGFSRLVLARWRQFGHVELDLSSRLTILTGANGAGKTTLLSILGRHFDWPSQVIGTPVRDSRGNVTFVSGLRGVSLSKSGFDVIGNLIYTNGIESECGIPQGVGAIRDVMLLQQQFVPGLYLSSHRSLSQYQPVQTIPAVFAAGDQLLAQYVNEIRNRYLGNAGGKSAMLIMKEALLSAALWGEGNSSVSPNAEASEVWNGFQDVLRTLVPESLRFQRLRAEPPELLVETGSGSFGIDALSGGLSAIVELAWQIFLRSREYNTFTVCFDEPENHLHPTLQRELIPKLLSAFPNVSLVVATHSPLIVTSSADASVFVLDYSTDGLVYSSPLDFSARAASAEETLTEVLGVPSTFPVWADAAYERVISGYLDREFTPDLLRALRDELRSAGLGSELPRAVTTLTDAENDEGGS